MIKLILVRHAKTQTNYLKKLSGHSETTLSQEGLMQVKRLTRYLSQYKIDYIYSSPMQRCIETIKDIAEKNNIPFKIMEDFREINFGSLENYTFDDIKKFYPEEVHKMIKEGHSYRYPEGESLIDSYERVVGTIKSILKDTKDDAGDQNILICAHAGTIRNLLSYFVTNDYEAHWHFQIDNASVTIVDITDHFPVITMMNKTDY